MSMTLLEKAREHWRDNLQIVLTSGPNWVSLPWRSSCTYEFSGGVVNIGCDACALCHKYKSPEALCSMKCAVRNRTGSSVCKGSPWEDVHEALAGNNRARVISAMQRMVDFLDGLEDPEK